MREMSRVSEQNPRARLDELPDGENELRLLIPPRPPPASVILVVYSVSPKTFEGFVTSHNRVLLRVSLGADTQFPSMIENYFDDEYRGALVYGTLRWEDMPIQAWREKHFKGYLGFAVPPDGVAGQPGFYLFIGGKPLHHEPEAMLTGPLSKHFFMLRLEGKPGLPPQPKLPSWEQKVIGGIEKFLITSKLAGLIKAAAARAPKPTPRVQAPPKPPPGAAAPPPPKQLDPYKVLGVPQDTTKEIVDRVFRVKSRGCHPDGFSGLPAQILAEAEVEFKRLTNARECIYKERGWR